MCKEIKEDLKRIRSLKDDGRRDVEVKGDVGFVYDKDDDYGELLIDRGEAYGM